MTHPTFNEEQQEKMFKKIAPLVDNMRAKYPPELNIDGFEPTLTADITDIVLTVLIEFKSEMNRNTGFLRQWLNEDRITDPKKMVTNEQIENMLNL